MRCQSLVGDSGTTGRLRFALAHGSSLQGWLLALLLFSGPELVVSATATPGTELQGRVISRAGDSVSDVAITARVPPSASASGSWTTRTDQDGFYRLVHGRHGLVRLVLTREGYAPIARLIPSLAEQILPVFVLERSEPCIATVVRQDGQRVPEAEVTVWIEDHVWAGPYLTREDGSVTVPCPVSQRRLATVAADGTLAEGECSTECTLTLHPRTRTFRWEEHGPVSAQASALSWGERDIVYLTGSGNVGLPEDFASHVLSVRQDRTRTSVELDGAILRPKLPLPRPTDADSGDEGPLFWTSQAWWTWNAADPGLAKLQQLLGSTVYRSDPHTLTSTMGGLGRAATERLPIVGSVVDHRDVPIANARVRLMFSAEDVEGRREDYDTRAYSDLSGRFSFPSADARAPQGMLFVSAPGYRSEATQISPDRVPYTVDVVLGAALEFRLTAVDEAGQPVRTAQAGVFPVRPHDRFLLAPLHLWGSGLSKVGTADTNGVVAITQAPVGVYDIAVSAPGFQTRIISRVHLKPEGGEPQNLGSVELSRGAALEGVVTRHTVPVAGTRIEVVEHRPEPHTFPIPPMVSQSGPDGGFVLQGLKRGKKYDVRAYSAEYGAATASSPW